MFLNKLPPFHVYKLQALKLQHKIPFGFLLKNIILYTINKYKRLSNSNLGIILTANFQIQNKTILKNSGSSQLGRDGPKGPLCVPEDSLLGTTKVTCLLKNIFFHSVYRHNTAFYYREKAGYLG